MYLFGTVEQVTVDVVVTLYDTASNVIGRVDGPARGSEVFQFQTLEEGEYILEVAPFEKQTGKYILELKVVEPVATDPAGLADQLRREDILELLKRQEELQALPGEEYNYNNSAFIMLAEIVERTTGFKYGPDLFGSPGAGGIYTTVADFNKWLNNFSDPMLGGEEVINRLVTPDTLRRKWKSQSKVPKSRSRNGY